MSRLSKFFVIVFVIFALFPVLSGADNFLYHKGLLPSYPSLALMLLIFLPVLYQSLVNNGGQELYRLYSNTVWITLPIGMLALVSLVWGMHPGAYWEDNGRIIYFGVYAWVLLMVSVGIGNSKTILKNYRMILFIIFIGFSIAIWVDVFIPGHFSKQTHRAAGFYKNANGAAMSANFLAISIIDWKKHDKWNVFLLIFTLFAIFPTLSVSGLSLFLIVLISYIVINFKGHDNFLEKLAGVIIIPFFLFFLAIPFLDKVSDNRSSKNRIDMIYKLGQGDFSFVNEHGRVKLIFEYLDIIAEAPVVGQGTGFTYTSQGIRNVSPHNMLIKHWVEQGILGIFLYLLVLGGSFFHFLTLKDKRGMVLAIALIYYSFFDHSLLWKKPIIFSLGFIGALAYLEKAKPFPVANPGRKWVLQ